MKTLVIIPALNEAATLPAVIREIHLSLPDGDILVVNDGSYDGTGEVARNAGASVIEHPFNMGIGATMQTGFLYALQNGYEVSVQVDGDGQHPPMFLPEMVRPIQEGKANLVIGSRYLSDGGFKSTFLRKLGIRFFAMLVRVFTGKKVTDPTSGFRALDRKGLELFAGEYPSDYPEVEALILAHKRGLHIREIPIRMKDRQAGVSSIGVSSALYYMVKVTLSISIGSFRRMKS